jgi:SAM-dependent methyltransferase
MDAVVQFARRLTYAWRRHGWRLFGPLLWHNIVYVFGRLRGKRGVPDVSELDVKLGIDTHRIEGTSLMKIDGENLMHGHGYQPVGVSAFHKTIAALGIDLSHYTFIDYGSGKGRALLLATEFPFRRIIGVEYARELHDVAEQNVKRAQGQLPDAARLECVWADATRYEPPADPLVCFLYNPFDDKVMTGLLDRLRESYKATPRDIVIAYLNPIHRAAVDQHPSTQVLSANDTLVVYRLSDQKTA